MTLLRSEGSGEVSTGFYNGVATQSLRFEDGSSTHLTFTPGSASSATDRRKVTHAVWIKRCNLGVNSSASGTIYSSTKSGGGDYYQWRFSSDDKITLILDVDDSNFGYDTTEVYRDTTNWYHFVLIIDTTQSTNTDRVKLYANGVLQTLNTKYSGGHVSQNFETYVMDGTEDAIGEFNFNSSTYFDGYMCDFITTIGQDNTISQFGETVNGVWIAKAYSGSYGANGFRLEFKQTGDGSSTASSSTIGADTSGNDNHWKDNNLDAHDSNMPDSPENNWCNLMRIDTSMDGANDLQEGGLRAQGSGYGTVGTQFKLRTGKWYLEFKQLSDSGAIVYVVGILEHSRRKTEGSTSAWLEAGVTSRIQPGGFHGLYNDNGTEYKAKVTGYQTRTFSTLSGHPDIVGSGSVGSGSVVGILIDFDSSTPSLKYNVDGANTTTIWEESFDRDADGTALGRNDEFIFAVNYHQNLLAFNFGQDSTFAGQETAATNSDENGHGQFHSSVPSGYLALCSANLPDPTIGPQSGADSTAVENFGILTYTGDASSSRAITSGATGIGGEISFTPDWIWFAQRNNTSAKLMFDSVRGVNKALYTTSTGVETDSNQYGYLSAFNSNSFTATAGSTNNNYINENAKNIVAWCWKAGGAPTADNSAGAGNTPTANSVKIDGVNKSDALAGTIPATRLSANTKAGFSIVTYTANSNTKGTIAHGLTEAPTMVMIKNRDTSSNGQWVIGHRSVGDFNGQLYMDEGNFGVNSGSFDNTIPTSTVVTVNTDNTVNEGTDGFVMYCFHNVEGFSKVGVYIGSSTTDGTFVNCGFRPKWVLLKSYSQSSSWHIYDAVRSTYNRVEERVNPNSTSAADSIVPLGDFTSTGFKLRPSSSYYGQVNSSGSYGRYVYLAFAEQPFKFSNAR